MTVLEPAQVPGAFQQAFHLMRSGRPGPVLLDLPFDVQMTEIDFDPDTYEPLPVLQAARSRAQAAKRWTCWRQRSVTHRRWRRHRQRRRVRLLIEFAELVNIPVVPTLMGWGTIPDDHPLMAGMAGLQTSHRYGNATMLASDFVLGIGNAGPTGIPVVSTSTAATAPSFTSTSSPRRSAASSRPTMRSSPMPAMHSRYSSRWPGQQLRDWSNGSKSMPRAQAHVHRRALRGRPRRAAARVRGDEQGVRPRDALRQQSA